MNDALGDRMKMYENAEGARRLMPLLPIVARIDGRAFHSFTRDMERPYDKRMSDAMIETTRSLVEETSARCGYTQSDEITLVWLADTFQEQVFFDGRIQKMVSVLAALATVHFYRNVERLLPAKYAERMPTFDCRIWNVPNQTEAANAVLWREQDASKNSISMAGRCYYSHQDLMSKNGSQMQEMLFQKGVNWNDYPAFFKRGTFVQRRVSQRPYTVQEIDKLPVNHQARTDSNLMVERSDYVVIEMPKFSQVTNREAIIFSGAQPELKSP